MDKFKRFLADESGPVAVEYAVLLTLVTVASIGPIAALGHRLTQMFVQINEALEEAGV